MKCDWCSTNLPDDGLVCAHCGHDNALSLDDEIVSSAKVIRETAPLRSEATLIPFPNSSATVSERSVSASADVPAWRNQIRESVRLYREQQRSAVAETLEEEEVIEPEPEPEEPPPAIVEAALKRLRRPVPTIAEATSRQAVKTPPAEKPVVTETFDEGPLFSSARLITHPKSEQSPAPVVTSERSTSTGRLSSETAAARHEPGVPTVGAVNPYAQPARLADRALAWIFDLAVIIVASVPLFAIHSITQTDTGHSVAYTALAIVIWVCFIYQLWTMLVARRTCGMAWRNLKVVDAETHGLTFAEWRMFARSLAATVGLFVPPLNLLVIWSSGSQAGFADVLSRTRVCSFSKAPPLNPPTKS